MDDSFSALVTASKHISGEDTSSIIRGTFGAPALAALRDAACAASALVVDGDAFASARSGSKISRHGGGFSGVGVTGAAGQEEKRDADVSTILPAGRSLHEKLEKHLKLLDLIRMVRIHNVLHRYVCAL
jgi:hypothetical protein